MRKRMILTLGVLGGALLFAGCSEKFTRDRYETLYVGQSAGEIEMALGEETDKVGIFKTTDTVTYIHRDPFYKAIILIRSGKIAEKSWYDGQTMEDDPLIKLEKRGRKPAPRGAVSKQTTITEIEVE